MNEKLQKMHPQSGRLIQEDGVIINKADAYFTDSEGNVRLRTDAKLEAPDINLGDVGLVNKAEEAINPATEDKQDAIIENQTDGSQKAQIVKSNGEVVESFGSPSTVAEYTSPSDFTATYTSTTTLTLSGVPFTISDSSQLVYIRVIHSDNTSEVYTNGSGGVTMTVSSNVITIVGAGTPFASGDVYEVGINDQRKAYNPSTNSQMVSPLKNVWNQYTDPETLAEAQDLTDSYADFGVEIDMRGYNRLGVFIITDVNDSENVDLKVLGKHTSEGADKYEIDSISTKTLWTTGATDAKLAYTFETDGAIPFLQLQAIAGTVGSTPGDLTIVITKAFI